MTPAPSARHGCRYGKKGLVETPPPAGGAAVNRLWVLAGLGVAAAFLLLAAPRAPAGAGAAWNDPGPDGHSQLAAAVSRDHPALVAEATLGALPAEAGAGDLLVLFPTHRPASPLEVDRVEAFVSRGGLLLMSADGQNAQPWAAALGVRFKSLPALLPPESVETCVETTVPVGSRFWPLCLPSPTAFANVTWPSQEDSVRAYDSSVPVFLDLDFDGNLSLEDQGPMLVPMVLEWTHGRGRVIAVADADAWRNGALSLSPDNLQVITALAEGMNPEGTVYLDSSGVQPGALDKMRNPVYRALAAPDLRDAAALALVAVGLAAGAGLVPRARPRLPHDPPADASDPEVEAAARALIDSALSQRLVATPLAGGPPNHDS